MHILYVIGRIFPFFAVPLALALCQFALFFRRKGRKVFKVYFGIAGLLVLLSLLWIVFRGDVNSDKWIRALTMSD